MSSSFVRAIGPAVSIVLPRPRPQPVTLEGAHVRLEPLVPALHGEDLIAAFAEDHAGMMWDYLFQGPFPTAEATMQWLEAIADKPDPLFFTVIPTATGKPAGVMSLMRIDPAHGVIEVGGITLAPVVQRSPATTEAEYLLMRYAFEDLGYRRYEWKCNALNAPSRVAAYRLGFSYEGIFRQHMVVKGHNRDTAWFAIMDHQWPAAKAAFETWLAAENFGPDGSQVASLSQLMAAALPGRPSGAGEM